jgi:hypothetical protein
MSPTTSRPGALAELGASALRWFAGWWRIVQLGAVILALSLKLIPLVTALFVALRCTIPYGADIAAMRSRGE